MTACFCSWSIRYVSRLADAHAVSVGNLVGRELLLVSSKPRLPFGPFVPRDGTTSLTVFAGVHVRPTAGESELADGPERWKEQLIRPTFGF